MPARGSHRSGRADFPHPAPQTTDFAKGCILHPLPAGRENILASSAIRCSPGEMEPELEVSVIVPSNSAVAWPPLPSTGSLRAGSPASSVLWVTPTSERPSRRASFPSHSGTPILGRHPDLPGSWGTPVHVPCSPTPAEPQRQVSQRFGLAFRNWNNVGLCHNTSFGAVLHGPYTRCPRFTNAVTCTHAGLASGWLPALARRDCLPAGFLSEVSTIP